MKRKIRCSSEDYYTHFVDEEPAEAVSVFMETSFTDNPFEDGYKKIITDAVDTYWKDYNAIEEYDNPRQTRWPAVGDGYGMRGYDPYADGQHRKSTSEDKRRFYKKYRDFAERCKEVSKAIRATGYGRYDYFNIRLRDALRNVEYHFPYGWRY